jgi:Divergent InlB B-repeat domain
MSKTKTFSGKLNSICTEFLLHTNKFTSAGFAFALFLLFTIITPSAANAQSATVYGSLGNFDVINHTGHHSHGFEIELEGIHPEDVYYSFSVQRYGLAHVTATATGTLVRWESSYANGAFTQTTLPHAPNTPFAGSCYQWGANYNQSACEHFGVSLQATPTHTTYRWLIEDTANPGTLVGVDPPIAIVSPVYVINPPVVQGGGPELVDVIEAPEPAEAPELYGDAQWVKVFKVQLNREANLDELVSDNAVVPQDAAHLEVEWEIVQQEPASNSNSNGNRRRRQHTETLNVDTRAVVRRYETYAFTGQYDPVTHEALCADLTCNTAAVDEVGELIGAQMTAANISVASVSVAKTGNGSVNSSDSLINCGSKCAAIYDNGAAVTLTASPATNYLFTGWSGACAGSLLTCTVNAAQSLRVTANFARPFDVNAKTSGKGSVVAPAAGINCGKTCSSKVAPGTNATFTATPDSGFRFVNWSGACSGTSRTCVITINNSTSVQANFAK